MSGEPSDPHSEPENLRLTISNELVRIKKELYGKGPTKAKTYINDNYVFTVLEGGLTRNEETLLAAGEHRLVREFRLRFRRRLRCRSEAPWNRPPAARFSATTVRSCSSPSERSRSSCSTGRLRAPRSLGLEQHVHEAGEATIEVVAAQ